MIGGVIVIGGYDSAHNENNGFGKISSISVHRRVAWRFFFFYSLPVDEKNVLEIRPWEVVWCVFVLRVTRTVILLYD